MAKFMPAKVKIFVALGVWVVASALMLGYFFKILDNSNNGLVGRITAQRKELMVLEAEQESYRLARRDVEDLKKKTYQPEDFFSKDVTLVREIEVLEGLGDKYGVDISLSGLSGTVKAASKAKTKGDLASVPYALNINGPFARVVDVIETLENLDFITAIQSLTFSSSGADVAANLTANFYVRK